MSPTSRREFLAAAGGTLAASAIANSELLAASERAARRRRARDHPAAPSDDRRRRARLHRPRERLRWRFDPLPRQQFGSIELQLCRLGTDVTAPRATRSSIPSGSHPRRPSRSIRVVYPGGEAARRPDDARRSHARGLDSPMADSRTPGDPWPFRRARS